MITTAKPATASENTNVVPTVYFLHLNSALAEETPELIGGALVSIEDSQRYGKVEDLNGRKTFYLKQFRGGRPGELLVDPWGMLARPEDLSAYATQRGHRFCEYVRVREDLFEQYRKYLVNRNPLFFRSCESAILNGDNT